MYFDTLRIRNFGPFDEFQTRFSPNGINLITGYNGFGKTQLLGSILYSLCGAHMVEARADGQLPCEVSLVIRENEESETIVCRLSEIGSSRSNLKRAIHREVTHYPNEQPLAEWASYLQKTIVTASGPSLWLPSHDGDRQITRDDLERLSQIQVKNSEYWQSILDSCTGPGTIMRAGSLGVRSIVRVAMEVIRRSKMDRPIPLLVDEPFGFADQAGTDLLWELFDQIGNKNQVIIATGVTSDRLRLFSSANFIHTLSMPSPDFVAPLYFNYLARPTIDSQGSRRTGNRRFVLGNKLPIEENLLYEFKEVKGSNPVRAITDVADQYVVAFLNMRRTGTGRIYWGVRDQDRSIAGVTLRAEERDRVRRLVTEKLHKIEPKIAPTAFEVNLHKVYDDNGVVDDCYVVEVKVPSSPSEILYATGSYEVYVKTDAGKKRLSPLELQREVLWRRDSRHKD